MRLAPAVRASPAPTWAGEEKIGGINPPLHFMEIGLQVLQMSQAEWGAEVFAKIQPVLFRNGHKYVDDCWVKLAAGAALDFFAGVGHR